MALLRGVLQFWRLRSISILDCVAHRTHQRGTLSTLNSGPSTVHRPSASLHGIPITPAIISLSHRFFSQTSDLTSSECRQALQGSTLRCCFSLQAKCRIWGSLDQLISVLPAPSCRKERILDVVAGHATSTGVRPSRFFFFLTSRQKVF